MVGPFFLVFRVFCLRRPRAGGPWIPGVWLVLDGLDALRSGEGVLHVFRRKSRFPGSGQPPPQIRHIAGRHPARLQASSLPVNTAETSSAPLWVHPRSRRVDKFGRPVSPHLPSFVGDAIKAYAFNRFDTAHGSGIGARHWWLAASLALVGRGRCGIGDSGVDCAIYLDGENRRRCRRGGLPERYDPFERRNGDCCVLAGRYRLFLARLCYRSAYASFSKRQLTSNLSRHVRPQICLRRLGWATPAIEKPEGCFF